MREKEDFRENLARLYERFPGREAITIPEAAPLFNAKPERLRNDKNFPKKKLLGRYVVPLVGLARWMS